MVQFFDFEVYKNLLMLTCMDREGKINKFIINKNQNDLNKLIEFCSQPGFWFVGYNNHFYDNLILNYLIHEYTVITNWSADRICKAVYRISYEIINEDNRKYKYYKYFNSLDLMRVGNIQKPLKLVAASLKWSKIQDLPIPFDQPIKDEQVDLIAQYNLNDVGITKALYDKLLPEIKLRGDIRKFYQVEVMDEADSGIANKLFEKLYSDATNQHPSKFKDLRTMRSSVKFSDAIFPQISFKTTQLSKFLEEMKEQVLTIHSIEDKITIDIPELAYKGKKYSFGAGGLHSKDKGVIFESSEEISIEDADVTSYYPSIMINGRLKPEHLEEVFIDLLKSIRDERVIAKREKNDIKAQALKIVINATFGKLGYGNFWLYDPLVMLQVTLNGQLFLLMLIEMLGEEGIQVISANTDGVTCIIKKGQRELYTSICQKWSTITGFDLEFTKYKKYVRRDVNNYLVLTEEGKIKSKGDFVKDIVLQKGYEKPIIALAIHKYFVEGVPIQDTILNHKDIYDFCIAKKPDSKFVNEFHSTKNGEYTREEIQKSMRYYVSNRGGTLVKIDNNFFNKKMKRIEKRITNYEADQYVTLFNDYFNVSDFKEYDINYSYYINETQKIINAVVPPQQSLFGNF
jgi:hypothetical protein